MARRKAWVGGGLGALAVGLGLWLWPAPTPLDFTFRLGDGNGDGRLDEVEFLSATLLGLRRPALPGDGWVEDPLPWMVRFRVPLPEAQRQRVALWLRQGQAPAKHQQQVFRWADLNRDGWLTREELAGYAQGEAVRDRQLVLNRQARGRVGPSERWVASALGGFDRDGDARLSLPEFEASLQGEAQAASASKILARFDRDGDRHLSAGELGAMVGRPHLGGG